MMALTDAKLSPDHSTKEDENSLLRVAHDEFLETSTAQRSLRWENLLRTQVECFSSAEIAYLRTNSFWKGARSVLDVGCGEGSFLRKVADAFPEKRFAGLDVSDELIRQARKTDPSGDYRVGDLYSYASTDRFDLIVLRFVVQHLSDFDGLLAACRRLLSREGVLLLVEPDLASSSAEPPLRAVENVFARFEESRTGHKKLRGALRNPRRLLREQTHWTIAADNQIEVSLTAQRAAGLLEQWLSSIDTLAEFNDAVGPAYRELSAWGNGRLRMVLRAITIAH